MRVLSTYDRPDDGAAALSHEPFDPQYMGRLFRLGYQQALAGNSWLTPDQDEETVADRVVQ